MRKRKSELQIKIEDFIFKLLTPLFILIKYLIVKPIQFLISFWDDVLDFYDHTMTVSSNIDTLHKKTRSFIVINWINFWRTRVSRRSQRIQMAQAVHLARNNHLIILRKFEREVLASGNSDSMLKVYKEIGDIVMSMYFELAATASWGVSVIDLDIAKKIVHYKLITMPYSSSYKAKIRNTAVLYLESHFIRLIEKDFEDATWEHEKKRKTPKS